MLGLFPQTNETLAFKKYKVFNDKLNEKG